jgi:DNA-binding MarR family transcriptional regulator
METLGSATICWQMNRMTSSRRSASHTSTALPSSDSPAPVTAMVSSRLMVLANLLKRGAILRYRRTAALSAVEFGLVASLGRNPPMSVISLASAVGMDKGQISRALAGLVSRKLVSRQVNPKDNREVLVELTRAGAAAHEILLSGAQERTASLLSEFSDADVKLLLRFIDRLTDKAADMLQQEKDQDRA